MIKISRAVPVGVKPTMPAGAFLIDEAGNSVVWRVRRLTELAMINNDYKLRRESFSSLIMWAFTGCLLGAITFMAANTQMLMLIHTAIERIVSTLR